MKFKHFLFDIEGTTTPISFVHKVLFPYSKKNLRNFLKINPVDEKIFEELKLENKKDNLEKKYNIVIDSSESVINYLEFLISVDRKSKPLKEIQGKIWNQGYQSNELKSVLYSDVLGFFKKIKSNGSQISIYSSGSVEAQKLIFEYSNLGNLKEYISQYFDTNMGGKRESNSYKNILLKLELEPKDLVFFTDIKEEADAANEVGIKVYLMEREGNFIQKENLYDKLKSFNEFN